MSRRVCVVAGAAGLVLHAALLTGLLAGAPLSLRLLAAFLVLVVSPGAAIVALGVVPPARGGFAPVWAVGFGVAWNALLILVCDRLDVSFLELRGPALALTSLLWVLAAARGRSDWPADGPRGVARAAVLAAVALAALYAARLPTPATYVSDSPDHVGTIRRMLATGEAFPRDAFFVDAGALGADPRKALWHPQVALIARLAAADPYDTWRGLSTWIAPVFVFNGAALGWLLAGGRGAAVGAWAALLVLGGSTNWFPIRKAVFSTFLSSELCTAALLASLADLGARPRRARLAAVGLALGAAATHVFAAVQLGVVWGALAVGLMVRDRGFSAAARRLAATAALALGACLPWLLWRAGEATGARNVIHTETQGLLALMGGAHVVSPGVIWEWMGPLWVLLPVGIVLIARRDTANTAALSLLTTSLGVVLVVFNPIAVAVLEPRVGYLLMRMAWMVPAAGLVTWMTLELGAAVAHAHGRARLAAVALAAAFAIVLAPAVRDTVVAFAVPRAYLDPERTIEPERWRDELAWLDAHLPAGTVVLSDPLTSYAVPMFTRHHVVTLVDQHSSPNDTLALERIMDARDALDPWGTWARTRAVIERYGATAIVLQNRFAERPLLDYWAPGPEWFAAARARFDREPSAFPRLRDRGDWVVYGIARAPLTALTDPPARRPQTRPWRPEREPVARRVAPGMPAAQRLELVPRLAAPGDTLRGLIEWRAVERMAPGSYQVAVRFDRALPAGLDPPDAIGKPVRKLVERARGERYRFRVDHLPVGGQYGVDLWRADEVVRDSFEIVVPHDAAPGRYDVRVLMLRQPHYPNYRLSDYFIEEDYYSGVRLGGLEVQPRPERASR